MSKLGTIKERLFRHRQIDVTTGCWLWTGFRSKKGYGRVYISKGISRFVHGVAYKEFVGEPVNSVLHTCPNKNCFNPEHLYDGTAQDNSDDIKYKVNVPSRGNGRRKVLFPD